MKTIRLSALRQTCALFSEKELKQIEEAVAKAEEKTSGEIVVVAVAASGEYRWAHCVWAVFGWILGSLVLWGIETQNIFLFSLFEVLLTQMGVAAIFTLLPYYKGILRLTLPARLAARHVHRESLATFTACGVYETRDRTGILIYLSELERRVQIIADKGIHGEAGEAFWSARVEEIATSIREGQPAHGLCQAIATIGNKLALHFPPRVDDANELGNSVRLGDQVDKE